MKRIFFLGLLLGLGFPSLSQNITGDWYGILKTPNQDLRVIFHVILDSDRYLSTLEVPSQSSKRLLMDSTTIQDNHIRMKMTQLNLYYNGTYYPDSGLIKGIFNQNSFSEPMELSKKLLHPLAKEIRPQEPVSFPYKQEEINFKNPKSSISLSGTLTLPSTGKITKLIILLAGSGPQNRDEELKSFNQKPFLVWSDFLARNGIAVLRYDKRGIGKSEGDYSKSTSFDFESDATSAINYVRSRPDLKNLELGLMGHSEGGLIAPMVASTDKNIKFLVLLGAPGVPISQLMVKQNKEIGKLQIKDENQLNAAQTVNQNLYNIINSNKTVSVQELNSKCENVFYDYLKAFNKTHASEEQLKNYARQQVSILTSPWYRTFLSIVPDNYLSKLTCPVLAINGTLDLQVNAESNLAGIKSSLEKAGNKNFEIVPLRELNHLLQKAKTGSVSEYGEIQETVNPLALNTVLEWINKIP